MNSEEIDSTYIDPVYNMDFENSDELKNSLPEIHLKMFLMANYVLTIMRSGIHQYFDYYPEYNWDLLLDGAKIIGGEKLVDLIKMSSQLHLKGNTTDEEYNKLQNEIDPIDVYNKIMTFIATNKSEFKVLI